MKCRLGIGTLIVLASAGCEPTADESFEFALLGDNPYSPESYTRYERLIDDVNAYPELQWVVHLGDLKGGEESCSDEELQRRFDLNQRFHAAFILTPGDNDWLDCVREGAGSYSDYERLEHLRALFYPEPGMTTGGSPMAVVSQASDPEYSEFVENVMWEHGGVFFATVHILGPTRPPTDPAIMQRRDRAAAAWIAKVFERAKASDGRGVFLATQVDPWVVWGVPGAMRRFCPECPLPRRGIEWLYPALIERCLAFERPVVLAVGDTHIYRIDKPLYTDEGALVENFTRVEVFGFPQVHWVGVRVEPDTPWVFSFRQQIVD
jgi:hypothetical protein